MLRNRSGVNQLSTAPEEVGETEERKDGRNYQRGFQGGRQAQRSIKLLCVGPEDEGSSSSGRSMVNNGNRAETRGISSDD